MTAPPPTIPTYTIGGTAEPVVPYPTFGVIGPQTPRQLSVDHLLAVARRALGEYAEDLERSGRGGWEILVAAAHMWSRVSLAVGRFEVESFPSSATGPARTTVELSFSRANNGAGQFTVKAGTLVRARTSGAVFRTLADVQFGTSELGPITVMAEAVGLSEEFNVLGEYVSTAGERMAGEIETIDMPLLDPPQIERSLAVTNVDDATGGRIGMLDVHGADVDVQRIHGEADASYAKRVIAVAEAVAPIAVRRQVQRFLEALGLTDADWRLVETWAPEYAICDDAPEAVFPLRPEYNPVCCDDDDITETTWSRGRVVDNGTVEGAAVLEIVDLTSVEAWGSCDDDPAETQAELVTSLGTRPTSADDLDWTSKLYRTGCDDGGDYKREAIFKRLGELLESIAALGVVITLAAQGD